MAYISRRNILRGSAALGFTASAGILGAAPSAFAADTSGYKALVCVYLSGGMDGADTVLPTDPESHAALAAVRGDMFAQYKVGSGTSTRDPQNALALRTARDFQGRGFGLAPELSALHDLYQSGKMAVIGNVGPLVVPTTRTQLANRSVKLPKQLFSHSSQANSWLSYQYGNKRYGWGGRFMDVSAPASGLGRTFAAVNVNKRLTFQTGERIRPFPARAGGVADLNAIRDRGRFGGGADEARRLLSQHFGSEGAASDNVLVNDLMAANKRTLDDGALFKEALEGAVDFDTVFPDTDLGRRLRDIARTISVRSALSVGRQVFYAQRGGFDTHSGQYRTIAERHTEVSDAIGAFNAAMVELGIDDEVTLFTTSEFGRTVQVNGDGTDHGWGGHHFVVGGAVRGGEIYGNIPDYDLGSQSYSGGRGRLIPDMAVDQYAGALGRWFGLSDGELRTIFPNLGNFGSMPDLFGMGGSV